MWERMKNDNCKSRMMNKELVRLLKGMFITCLMMGIFWTFDMGMQAAELISGSCGDNVTYVLTDDGTLTISGTGAMYDYALFQGEEHPPWYEYRSFKENAMNISIEKIVIEEGVTTIGNGAFSNCAYLKEIILPEGIISIGSEVFSCCWELENIELPNSLISIGNCTFGNTLLSNITIPENVKNICDDTFWAMQDLETIKVVKKNPYFTIDENGVLYNKDFSYLIKVPEKSFTGDYIIPNTVNRISGSAFTYCEDLNTLIVSENVCRIEAHSFQHCENLKAIYIPKNVTSIGELAFHRCDNLQRIYYAGTEKQWNQILIESDNDILEEVNIVYNSEAKDLLDKETVNKIIEVKVTAEERETGNIVEVINAEVKLYTDMGVTTFLTNSNGIAEVSLEGLTNEQIKNATISASKVVSRGKAIDGSARDDLFEHFPHDENGDYYRYTMELHSETIDSYGNWCGVEIYDEKTGNIKSNIDLTLSEPRMLVNLSVCYFADDIISQGQDYKENIKTMLNEYAHRIAEATDAHIIIDKVLLFSTDNRFDFYFREGEKPCLASMADIQIQADMVDVGDNGANVTIHNNAYQFGYFHDESFTDIVNVSGFENLPDMYQYSGRRGFPRIISGAVDINGNSMVDNIYNFSAAQAHETGHYLLGFKDEYLRGDGEKWVDCKLWKKPYKGNYGLMDNQYDDIELSRNIVEYAYMKNNYDNTSQKKHTAQSWKWKCSCEDFLADWLTSENRLKDSAKEIYLEDFPDDDHDIDFNLGKYISEYFKVEGMNDRTANYSYAGLEEGDFLSLLSEAAVAVSLHDSLTDESLMMTSSSNLSFTKEPVGDVTFATLSNSMVISVVGDNNEIFTVSWRKSDEDSFETALHNGTTTLPIAQGDLAEIHVSDGRQYNVYFIDRSENTDVGYIYMSADNAVTAYVANDTDDSYSFIADNAGYVNGEYISMNQATRISTDSGNEFDSGEIYSVASYMAEIDYTTLSWFKVVNGEYTALETDYSKEENMNIGARADLDGPGTYVLMAKPMQNKTTFSAQNLRYKQSVDFSSKVTLLFDDPNTNSKYYNVYYSDTELTDKNADNVVVRSFGTDSTELTINLIEPNRTVYAAVEIVLEDGSRSELSKIELNSGKDRMSITRVSGNTRYDTGYKVAEAYKEYLGVEEFDAVIVATGKNFADALSGSYLSVVKKAPILLTNGKADSVAELHDYIKENVIEGGTIYILGGEAAVPKSVENIMGYNVKRLFGTTRYDTNLEILKESGSLGDELIIATGKTFADSLSASALKKPILLIKPRSTLLTEQKKIVSEVKDGNIYIIGGEGAVSASIENTLKTYGNVERIYGASRYDTSVAVAERFFGTTQYAVIANGKNFPDGLCGGPLAAELEAPLILTADGKTASASSYVNAEGIKAGYVLGGNGALSDETVMQVFQLKNSDEIILN